MYKVSWFKQDRDRHYIMVQVTRAEAWSLVKSLMTQLANDDPNTGRAEPMYETADGKEHGHFSISVQDPLFCKVCGEEFKPFTGHRLFDVLVCGRCDKELGKEIERIKRGRPSREG